MSVQLSGEVDCSTLNAFKQTAKTYIRTNYLNLHGNICHSLRCIYGLLRVLDAQTARERNRGRSQTRLSRVETPHLRFTHVHSRIRHYYITHCSMVLRRKRIILDNLGNLITCFFQV